MIDPISPTINLQTENKKKPKAMIIGVIIVIAALAGGLLFFRQSKKTEQAKVITEENKKEPTSTPKPTIDKTAVKIQVLNGTGTPGQAGLAVEALKKAGYNGDNIKTDNAKEFTNTVTTISSQDGFTDAAADIKDVLSSTFTEIKIDPNILDKGSEFNIIIVTGGKIFEEATPTTTSHSPTPSPIASTLTPSPTSSPTPSPTPTP